MAKQPSFDSTRAVLAPSNNQDPDETTDTQGPTQDLVPARCEPEPRTPSVSLAFDAVMAGALETAACHASDQGHQNVLEHDSLRNTQSVPNYVQAPPSESRFEPTRAQDTTWEPHNPNTWLPLCSTRAGYFPVVIQALPEGTCHHIRVPVYQVRCPHRVGSNRCETQLFNA